MALGPLAAASVVVPPPSDKIAGGSDPGSAAYLWAGYSTHIWGATPYIKDRPSPRVRPTNLPLDEIFGPATVDQSVKRRKGERDSRQGLHRAVVASRLGPLPEDLTDIRWSSGSTRRPGIVDGTINPADRDVLKDRLIAILLTGVKQRASPSQQGPPKRDTTNTAYSSGTLKDGANGGGASR
jgi:hypothetical protein